MLKCCEADIRDWAAELMLLLGEQGYHAVLAESSFRDYLGKLSVMHNGIDKGLLVINYSPNRKRFTVQYGEIRDQDVITCIQALVSQLGSSPRTPMRTASRNAQGFAFAEAKYYFETLKPFAAYRFDFADLADAILRLRPDAGSRDELRFNFQRLSELYNSLEHH